jgi:hypothetical protein
MPSNPDNNGGSPEALARRHEHTNPSPGRLVLGGGIIVLMLLSSLAIVAVMMHLLSQTRIANRAPYPGLIVAPDDNPLREFPAPSLQIAPRLELEALRAREDRELNSYGWIDRELGIVRIPVERAMDLLLERGVPVRETNQPPSARHSSLDLLHQRTRADE